MKRDKKHWSDQPDIVLEAERLVTFAVSDRIFEVRRHPDGEYFITVGTLFGSQTIRCADGLAVFKAMAGQVDAKKGASVSLPEGCTLIDNPQPNVNA